MSQMQGDKATESSTPARRRVPRAGTVHAVSASLAVCAAAMFYFASIRPAFERAERSSELAQAIDTASQGVLAAEQEEQRVRSELHRASSRLASVSIELVSIDARNERIAELTALADESGLAVDEITPGRVTSSELFDKVEIRLRGRGGYTDLARFIHLLSRDHPDTEVRTFRAVRGVDIGTFEMLLVWRALPRAESQRAAG